MRRGESVDWLIDNWVVGASFIAVASLTSLPILISLTSWPLLLILLCSPVYMLHQVEEHCHDRFRRFVNEQLFGGRCAMTRRDVFIVNVPLVWGLNLAAAYAAVLIAPAAGLIAGYAMLVNALGHIGAAVSLRSYNPGLLSATLLFLPLGTMIVLVAGAPPSAMLGWHLASLTGALIIHAAIAASAIWRSTRSNG